MVRISCSWQALTTCFTLVACTIAQSGPQSPARSFPQSIALSYQIIGHSDKSNHASTTLATIDYDPANLENTLSSWTPPLSELDKLKSTSPEPVSSPLIRILLPNGSSSVTGLSSLDPALSQDINILINPDGTVVSAHINARTPPPLTAEEEQLRQKEERLRKRGKPVPPRPKPQKKKKDKKTDATEEVTNETVGPIVTVNLAVTGAGPQPKWHSRAAPKMDASGREVEPEEVVEKTFLQKYWYILLALAFLVLGGGGGGGS